MVIAIARVSDTQLAEWAAKRADDAGRLARELVEFRRAEREAATTEPTVTLTKAQMDSILRTAYPLSTDAERNQLLQGAIQSAAQGKWRPMSAAPKDGRMLRLRVQPDPEAHTSFEDSSEPYETIGFNNLSNTLEDVWEFAGWDWSHDCFVTGGGTVSGWTDFCAPTVTVPTAVHSGWRWKHESSDTWQYVNGIEPPELGFTPSYEAAVTYEKVFTMADQPPAAWWYEDKTGCIYMSVDIALGLQHEAEFGAKLNWMTSTEPSRFFANFGDIERFQKIRLLCGYIQNGSGQTVTITQDDATSEWIVRAGSQVWSGASLSAAVDAAELPEGI
jgi:hypothetical protein